MALTDIERFMLSADDGFNYACLQARFSPDEDRTRFADKSIQKARRRGWIAYKRERGLVLWRPTEAGRAALRDAV